MLKQIEILRKEILALQPETPAGVESFRLKYLSRKGIIPALFDDLKLLAPDRKKEAGRQLNELKQLAEIKLKEWSESSVAGNEVVPQVIDLTLPTVPNTVGSLHPLPQRR